MTIVGRSVPSKISNNKKVLILAKLGHAWAKECYHLSYGMVELPEGKMKSREGTVVDADDLIQEMVDTAEQTTKELGKVEGFSEDELKTLYHTIGLGALKYFILKVDPKKKMLFDPKESIDFNGHTGPFIQYTYARIQSVLSKAGVSENITINQNVAVNDLEKELIKLIYTDRANSANEVSSNSLEYQFCGLIENPNEKIIPDLWWYFPLHPCHCICASFYFQG